MKILVPVKRVVDYNVKVRVKADDSGLDLANVKMSMNPFDEIAVEEAVRLKEAGVATEIVAVSAGVAACQETLRTALALGADRAILIETDAELQPLAVAKLLKAIVDKEQPKLVILGVERLVHAVPLAPDFHRDLGIAYKEKASLTPAARRFIDQIARSDPAQDLPPDAAASLTPCL